MSDVNTFYIGRNNIDIFDRAFTLLGRELANEKQTLAEKDKLVDYARVHNDEEILISLQKKLDIVRKEKGWEKQF